MPLLAALLACFRSEPAAAPDPAPVAHSAEVEVTAYREQDISKRQGHPKVHAYVTLQIHGPSPLEKHAEDGVLNVNMRREVLEKAGPLPLSIGQRLRIQAVPSLSSSYVQIRSFEPI